VIQLARKSTRGVVNVCSSTFTNGQIRPDARPMQTNNTCFPLSLSLSFREPFSRRRYFLLLSFLSKARRYVQESSKNTLLFFLCPLVSRSSQSRTILIKPCEFFKHVKTHVCDALSSIFGSTVRASVFEIIQTLTFTSKSLAGLFRREKTR
jgi:hypothetical protein